MSSTLTIKPTQNNNLDNRQLMERWIYDGNRLIIFIYFLCFVTIFTLTYMVKTGLREFGEVRRKLRKRGLSLRDALFRHKPYNFQPEKPASLREAAKRGTVFSLFVFSFTGTTGTIMLASNLTPLETPCQIFYAAATIALIFSTNIHFSQL